MTYKGVEIEVPQAQIEKEAAVKMLEYRHRLQYESMSSGIHYDQMYGQTQETVEKLLEKFRKEAFQELQAQMLLQAVITEERLTVSPEELETEALAIAARQKVPPEMVKRFLGEDYGMLRRDLLEKKALQFLELNNTVLC